MSSSFQNFLTLPAGLSLFLSIPRLAIQSDISMPATAEKGLAEAGFPVNLLLQSTFLLVQKGTRGKRNRTAVTKVRANRTMDKNAKISPGDNQIAAEPFHHRRQDKGQNKRAPSYSNFLMK
jgi:hypothetical protein